MSHTESERLDNGRKEGRDRCKATVDTEKDDPSTVDLLLSNTRQP